MMRAVVIVLALAAAFCAALGIVVRQLATRDVPADQGMSPTIVTTLLHRPLWWAGTATAVLGYVFQALALARGSLMLVQPLLVSSLLFALPISARVARQRVSRADWSWAVLLTGGLAVFVLLAHPREGTPRPPVQAWAVVAAVVIPLVLICVVGAARSAGTRRAVQLSIVVGVLFGIIAVLTKICMQRLEDGGPWSLLMVPAPYLLLLLGVVGTVVQQSAFHAGELQASVPTMLVLEPVVAVLLGVLVLGEELDATGYALLALPVAVAAMVAGTIALGRDSGALDEQIATGGPGAADDALRDPSH